MKKNIEGILQKLDELEREFQSNKGIMLTESDLHCLLFRKIYDLFPHNVPTFNSEIKGSPLHSEIKFFNEKGKLEFRPDITIIRPENYSIIHSIAEFVIKEDKIVYKPTSSKEFEFGGDVILIELKFCREKSGIKSISRFRKDLSKIRKIKRIVEGNDSKSTVYGIVAIFNKTDNKSQEFERFLHSHAIEQDIIIRYYTGKIEF